MTKRYNIVYRPDDAEFCQACTACAQRQFAALSDHYLLGEGGALVHATLCQFRAPEEEIGSLWEGLKRIVPAVIDLKTGSAYAKPGVGPDEGYSWVGLVVERDPELLRVQQEIVEFLQAHGLETLTGVGDNYFPHFTMARLRKDVPMLTAQAANQAVDATLQGRTLRSSADLGYASETGVFTERVSLRLDPPYVPLIQKPDCCAMACLQMILYRNGCGLYDQEELAVRFGVKIEPHVAGAFAEEMPIIAQAGVDEGIPTVESERLVNAFFREKNINLEAASFRYGACGLLSEFIKAHLRQNHDLWVEYHGGEVHSDDEYKGRYFHDGLIESFDGERVIVVNPKPTHRQRFRFPLPLLERAISGIHGRETGFVVVKRRA